MRRSLAFALLALCLPCAQAALVAPRSGTVAAIPALPFAVGVLSPAALAPTFQLQPVVQSPRPNVIPEVAAAVQVTRPPESARRHLQNLGTRDVPAEGVFDGVERRRLLGRDVPSAVTIVVLPTSDPLTHDIDRQLLENIGKLMSAKNILPHPATVKVQFEKIQIGESRFVQRNETLRLPVPKRTPASGSEVYVITHEMAHAYLDGNLSVDSKLYQKFKGVLQKQIELTAKLQSARNPSDNLIREVTQVSLQLLRLNAITQPIHEAMADIMTAVAFNDGQAMLKAVRLAIPNEAPEILDNHDLTTPFKTIKNSIASESHLFYTELKKYIWQNYLIFGHDGSRVVNALYRAILNLIDELGQVTDIAKLPGPKVLNQRLRKLFEREIGTMFSRRRPYGPPPGAGNPRRRGSWPAPRSERPTRRS